jgi:hypothetical protein
MKLISCENVLLDDVATAGVGGALAGGFLTASAILRRNLFADLGKAPPTSQKTNQLVEREPVLAG